MRLWHEKLLDYLPKQHLLGQHRECCALRGRGWNKKHSTVDYVFKNPYHFLYKYHRKVIRVLETKYNVSIDKKWKTLHYRGTKIGYDNILPFQNLHIIFSMKYIYKEHDDKYFDECVENLKKKKVVLCIE